MKNPRLTDTQVAVVAALVVALGIAFVGAVADAIAFAREAASPPQRSSPCD